MGVLLSDDAASFQSLLVGVAHILAALVRVSGVPQCAPLDSLSSARGVGHVVQLRS
jgi:hypothetical protein